MIRVDFKEISIENFLSVGKTPLRIDFSKGMNTISGYNRDENDIKNGVGKSLVLDSLYFAIFGTTLRKISKQTFIVNRKTGKNCCVQLIFDIINHDGNKENYVIERRLAPQSIKIWQNGNEITLSTTAETNKFIKELLHADEEIFQSCILMRANNVVSFMNKKDAEKRNFIESIFNLNVFSTMQKLLKDDTRKAKTDFSVAAEACEIYNKNITNYNIQLANLREEQQYINEKNKVKRSCLYNDIKIETDKCSNLKNKLMCFDIIPEDNIKNQHNVQSCEENIKKLKNMKNKLAIDSGVYSRELNNIVSKGKSCPTCGRDYEMSVIDKIDKRKGELQNLINDLNDKISLIDEKIDEFTSNLSNFNEKITIFNNKLNEIEFIKKDIALAERMIELYQRQLDEISDTFDNNAIINIEKMLNETKVELEAKKIILDAASERLGICNICENLLGEHGIRTFIVNKLLTLLNNRISFYLSSLNSAFDFKFNEYFDEEIKDSNGIICLYNNCSGAEMKKIDLAIGFAIADIFNIQQQVSYNILFFDEILDSSLDDKSLNTLLNFIDNYFASEKGIYIISHKNNIDIPNVKNSILLEKVNGFTTKIQN
jgi:DNA repair exonuclease SbcCD ATPase subunit